MRREQQRALLTGRKQQVQERVAALEAEMAALTHARRGEFDDDEHDPEGAALSSQWSMLAGLLESARAEARQAEAALLRLDTDQYGICTACGQDIPLPQLDARPFRERCVACSS